MVGRINICLSNFNNNDSKMDVEFCHNGDYLLTFYLNGTENIIDIFNDCFNNFSPNERCIYDFDRYRLISLFNLGNNVLFNCDSILLSGSFECISRFYKNNISFCNGRELIIEDIVDLDINIYNKLYELFGNNNVLVWIDGNSIPINLEKYKKTIVELDKYVSFIESFDFSPLEQCLMAYDLVRDRKYVLEDKGDESYVSRDLTSVLLGDKIVCVGFSNLFMAILNKLGIFSELFFMRNKNNSSLAGHARVVAYLVDKKYGIEGSYFFDPTRDCKKNNSNDFLSSYLFFCRNYYQMCEFDNDKYKYELCDIDFNENGVITIEFSGYDTKSINALQFLKAFYNVRKCEYYIDPSKYNLSIDVLKEVLYLSQLEDFRNDFTVELARKFNSFVSLREVRANEIVFDYMMEHNIDKEIEGIKLAKTLRDYLSVKKGK